MLASCIGTSNQKNIHFFREDYANEILTKLRNEEDISSLVSKLDSSQLNVFDTLGYTLFSHVISLGSWNNVELFLKKGANPNLIDKRNKFTPTLYFVMSTQRYVDSFENKVATWKKYGANFNYKRDYLNKGIHNLDPISMYFGGSASQFKALIKIGGMNPFAETSPTHTTIYNEIFQIRLKVALDIMKDHEIPIPDSISVVSYDNFRGVSKTGFLSLGSYLSQMLERNQSSSSSNLYREILSEYEKMCSKQ